MKLLGHFKIFWILKQKLKFVSLFLLKKFKRCGDRDFLASASCLDIGTLAGMHLPSLIFPVSALVHEAAIFTHRKFSSWWTTVQKFILLVSWWQEATFLILLVSSSVSRPDIRYMWNRIKKTDDQLLRELFRMSCFNAVGHIVHSVWYSFTWVHVTMLLSPIYYSSAMSKIFIGCKVCFFPAPVVFMPNSNLGICHSRQIWWFWLLFHHQWPKRLLKWPNYEMLLTNRTFTSLC